MYDEGALIKLMSGAKPAVVGGDAFIARVRVTSGHHAGAEGWLSSEFVSPPR